VGAEFDRQAGERFECMGQQQQLGFAVERRALHLGLVPGGADLEATPIGLDVHVPGRAHDLAARLFAHDKGQGASGLLKRQCGVDERRHLGRFGHDGEPQVAQARIGCRLREFTRMRRLHRFERHHGTCQRDRSWRPGQGGVGVDSRGHQTVRSIQAVRRHPGKPDGPRRSSGCAAP
jgi:hypothetical protein